MTTPTDAPRPPVRPWATVAARVKRYWGPDSPHHVIISKTRGGKTYLVVNGILPVLPATARVLYVDSKGDDPTGYGNWPGHAVGRIPRRMLRGTRRDHNQWYRLVVDADNYERARDQVAVALNTAWNEGDWTIYTDEVRHIVGRDREEGELNLPGTWRKLILRGGYKGIRTITATQTPSYIPRESYSQASFTWLGCIEDEDTQARAGEIAGNRRLLRPIMASIRKRQWLYTDHEEDERYYALTTVA